MRDKPWGFVYNPQGFGAEVRVDKVRDAELLTGHGGLRGVWRGSWLMQGRRSVGFRLLALILLFSSAVTLVSTVIQLYLNYRRDVVSIEVRLEEIENSYRASLAGALWHLDTNQIRLILDGIMRLPDINALEVVERFEGVSNPLVVSVGTRHDHAVMTRDIPLAYDDHGTVRKIGTLYVEATLEDVYRRLIEAGLVILISQGIKTFLVSMFTLYIVWWLLTRHLVDMARCLDRYDIRQPAPSMRLSRKAPKHQDELDRVVAAFNSMCVSLEAAYTDLRKVNADLEADIEARKAAEAEVIRLNNQLEERVRQRTAELEAANRELASFSYSVSHDLRAPLRRIDGFGRILQEDHADKLDSSARHYLDRIRAGAVEMGEMVDSFLKLARTTQAELTIEPVNLSMVVNTAIGALQDREPDRQVNLRIEPDMMVDGDRRLLAVALQNLVENSWKYTRDAQNPEIRVGRIQVSNGQNVYFVADNGAGFDMTYADRLFVPFSRLHRSEEFEGSGIGLATVQRVITRHGGNIWAEGRPGEGATFYFTLWEGGTDGVSKDIAGRR